MRNMAFACAFYTLSSAGMSVFNKVAIMALPLPITLVMVQMLFTVATICANWRSVHIGSRRDALRWGCTVPLLFSAMLVSSMFAMEHNTLGKLPLPLPLALPLPLPLPLPLTLTLTLAPILPVRHRRRLP